MLSNSLRNVLRVRVWWSRAGANAVRVSCLPRHSLHYGRIFAASMDYCTELSLPVETAAYVIASRARMEVGRTWSESYLKLPPPVSLRDPH
jgi:hypothetical protein